MNESAKVGAPDALVGEDHERLFVLPEATIDAGVPTRDGPSLTVRYRKASSRLAVTDGLGGAFALLFAEVAVIHRAPPPETLLPILLLAPFVWVACFHAFGLYSVRHLSAFEEFRRLISATSVALAIVLLGSTWWASVVYRRFFGVTWLFALVLALGSRRIWRWRLGKLRADGTLAARTIMLGTGEESVRLAASFNRAALGFRLLGHVAVPGGSRQPHSVPVVGVLDQLDETISRLDVDCVFVASTEVTRDMMVFVSQVVRRTGVELRMSANLADILVSRLSVQSFGDVLALSLRPGAISKTQRAFKRGFDVTAALAALVVLAPLMVGVALAVRLTSTGPVFFRQERVTKAGRVFVMLKFRTMISENERLPAGRTIDLTAPFSKLTDDPRLTRVGGILRRYSLDELPQLWHVVRGDLSLVGPRPLPAVQVAANQDLLGPRHEVRAGITGWWQVNGRSEVDPLQAIRMDAVYIENWSLSLDLFILMRTVGTVLSRRGAC